MHPYLFATLAQKAYDDPPMWAWSGVEAICTNLREGAVFSFRGSAGVGDWWTDFRACPWYDRRIGWCHAGFLKELRAFRKHMGMQFTVAARHPVYYTGHSKGGAQAIIYGAMMARAGYPPAGIMTFGAPRCGAALGKILINVPVIRYEQRGDPVPSMPPWFSKEGRVIEIGEDWDTELDHPMGAYLAALSRRGTSLPATPATS